MQRSKFNSQKWVDFSKKNKKRIHCVWWQKEDRTIRSREYIHFGRFIKSRNRFSIELRTKKNNGMKS